MKFIKNIVSVMLIISFTSYQAQASDKINLNDYDAIKKSIEIITDEFEGTTTISAPMFNASMGEDAYRAESTFPVSLTYVKSKDGVGDINVTLLMVYADKKWRQYDSAYANGHSLKLLTVMTDVQNCSNDNCIFTEVRRVFLTRSEIDSAANSNGFKFKVRGTMHDYIVEMPSPYLKAFLTVIDENEKSKN